MGPFVTNVLLPLILTFCTSLGLYALIEKKVGGSNKIPFRKAKQLKRARGLYFFGSLGALILALVWTFVYIVRTIFELSLVATQAEIDQTIMNNLTPSEFWASVIVLIAAFLFFNVVIGFIGQLYRWVSGK